MAKKVSDLLREWDGLTKKHREHLVKHKFSNKFAVVSKDLDGLFDEYKTYTKMMSDQSKVVESLKSQVVALAGALGKKLKARLIATKKEKEEGLDTLDDFCRCITHESDEVDPKLLGKQWAEMWKESKGKNKALHAIILDDSKMIPLLKKLADEAKKFDGFAAKQGTANTVLNRKTEMDIRPDIAKNIKSLSSWQDKKAAEEVSAFLKSFEKNLNAAIF